MTFVTEGQPVPSQLSCDAAAVLAGGREPGLLARLHQPDAYPAGWAYVVKPVQSITTQGSAPSTQASWPGSISA